MPYDGTVGQLAIAVRNEITGKKEIEKLYRKTERKENKENENQMKI